MIFLRIFSRISWAKNGGRGKQVVLRSLILSREESSRSMRSISRKYGRLRSRSLMISRALSVRLPLLSAGQGIESAAKEVRAFSTVTVLKLIKSGGKALLPFVASLVEQLIALLSTMEMEGIDYLYLRAAQYNLTEEKIDKARSAGVSQSPLMEAIERCLDVLDEPTMKELAQDIKTAFNGLH